MGIKERLFRLWKWYRTMNYLYCPACNSDAPKLYDCWCCHWYRGEFPPPKEIRQLWKRKYWALYNFEKVAVEAFIDGSPEQEASDEAI